MYRYPLELDSSSFTLIHSTQRIKLLLLLFLLQPKLLPVRELYFERDEVEHHLARETAPVHIVACIYVYRVYVSYMGYMYIGYV